MFEFKFPDIDGDNFSKLFEDLESMVDAHTGAAERTAAADCGEKDAKRTHF